MGKPLLNHFKKLILVFISLATFRKIKTKYYHSIVKSIVINN